MKRLSINNLLQGDLVVWMIFFFLCMISVVEIYSATSTMSYSSGHYWEPVLRHAAFLTFGAIFAWIIQRLPCNIFKLISCSLLIVSIILLIVALFSPKINDGGRWIGSKDSVSFQPSELAKMSLIGFSCFVLSFSRNEKGATKTATKVVLAISALILVLIGLENLSTAGILFLVILGILFYAKAPKKYMAIIFCLILGGAAMGAGTVYSLSKSEKTLAMLSESKGLLHRVPTWVHRLTNKEEIPQDAKDFDITQNIQTTHAKIAIATCNIVGKGPGNSVQRDFLPQAFSDFIYAIIIEELGIWGGAGVMFLYLLLMWRAMVIANQCKSLFPAYLVMGVALMMAVQAMVNMAVSVGAFPVTGQPLPLISRGGTSVLVNCAYIGMILSVSRSAKKKEPLPAVEVANAAEA